MHRGLALQCFPLYVHTTSIFIIIFFLNRFPPEIELTINDLPHLQETILKKWHIGKKKEA